MISRWVISMFDHLKTKKVDIACISETWLIGDDATVITEIIKLGYCTYYVPRESLGGGIGIPYSPELKLNRHKNKTKFNTFEFSETILQLHKGRKLLVTCIYQSCNDGLTRSSIDNFFFEFDSYLSS